MIALVGTMPPRATKWAANASTENLPAVDKDEGGVTLDTSDEMEAEETLEE